MSALDDEYFDATWDGCPNCGAVFGGDEYVSQRCSACGWQNGDKLDTEDDDEFPSEELGGHQDVWIEVDGKQQRVLADPNMSEETKKALAEMIKAATRAVQNGDFDD